LIWRHFWARLCMTKVSQSKFDIKLVLGWYFGARNPKPVWSLYTVLLCCMIWYTPIYSITVLYGIQTYLTIQVLKLYITSMSYHFAFDCGIGICWSINLKQTLSESVALTFHNHFNCFWLKRLIILKQLLNS